jgi:small-conductance mechanosensitive channel
MIRVQSVVVPVFLTLAVAALTGVILTNDWSTGKPSPAATAASPVATAALTVDVQLLSTAQNLAPLAVTPDEREFAQQAVQLADHELDLAFASALRVAADHSVPSDPRIVAIQDRLQKAQSLAAADQQRIAALTAQAAKASGAQKDALNEQIALHQSTLELDQDQAADAQEDLVRAGGDPRAQIQKMLADHEAATHNGKTAPAGAVQNPGSSYRGLAGRIQELIGAWKNVREIRAAQSDAEAKTSSLTMQHDAVEQQIEKEGSTLPELANRSAAAPALSASGDRSAALLTGAKHLAGRQQTLTSLNKRVSDIAQLAAVYHRWGGAARVERREALRSVLLGVLWIAVLVVFLHYLRTWLDRLGARFISDQRFQQSLRTMVATAVDLVGIVTIALLLFGPPSQVATALGLVGAGLTVALKDFVVGFIGWFILMGRRGIRVGDWVEIAGVRGEVSEIGLFRTILLETGNWTESGHPTGRRVSFPNTFAIEGHFFNFTTTGQWLWDEIRAALPADGDHHAMVESIRKRVTAATAEAARLAEQEWSDLNGSSAMRAFTAEPAVSLRPGPEAMEVLVRYVARATERNQSRAQLYHEVVEAIGETKTPEN